jgi:hypothetical protein
MHVVLHCCESMHKKVSALLLVFAVQAKFANNIDSGLGGMGTNVVHMYKDLADRVSSDDILL